MNNITPYKAPLLAKLRVKVRRHRLAFALAIAIGVALVLVFISINIYMLAGFSRYDLSRPGYEKERQEVTRPAPIKSYDTTSPITQRAIDEFLQEYDSRVRDITAFGNFGDGSLNDNELGINDDNVSRGMPQ